MRSKGAVGGGSEVRLCRPVYFSFNQTDCNERYDELTSESTVPAMLGCRESGGAREGDDGSGQRQERPLARLVGSVGR